MPAATSFDLGDLGNPNNPFVDTHVRYDGSDWLDPECPYCDTPLDERDWCSRCEASEAVEEAETIKLGRAA